MTPRSAILPLDYHGSSTSTRSAEVPREGILSSFESSSSIDPKDTVTLPNSVELWGEELTLAQKCERVEKQGTYPIDRLDR